MSDVLFDSVKQAEVVRLCKFITDHRAILEAELTAEESATADTRAKDILVRVGQAGESMARMNASAPSPSSTPRGQLDAWVARATAQLAGYNKLVNEGIAFATPFVSIIESKLRN